MTFRLGTLDGLTMTCPIEGYAGVWLTFGSYEWVAFADDTTLVGCAEPGDPQSWGALPERDAG